MNQPSFIVSKIARKKDYNTSNHSNNDYDNNNNDKKGQ